MGGRQEEQGDAQGFRLMQAQRRVEIGLQITALLPPASA